MHPPPDPAARWRGASAASLTAALAVAAHGVADGGPPPGAGVALLAVLAGTVGAAAATSRRAPGGATLFAILGSGQAVGHLVLAAAAHHHACASGPPAGPMIAAHALAVLAGTGLIAAADRLIRALSTAVRGVEGTRHPLAVAASSAVVVGDQPAQSMLLLAASVSHRGPPVSLHR